MSLRRLAADEQGMGLAELMVYSMLLVVVTAIAGTILITSLTSQRDISAMGSAASQGQNVANSVEEGVRTASALATPTADIVGQRLVARTATYTAAGVPAWQCRTWLFATDGSIYVKSASSAIAAPASLTSTALAGWLKLAQGVTPAGGTAVTLSGSKVLLDFKVAAGTSGGSPAHIVSTVSKLALPTTTGTGPTTC